MAHIVSLAIISIGIAATTFSTLAATTAQIDTARNKGIAWLIKNQNGEGAWLAGNESNLPATSTALDALRKANVIGPTYTRGLSWLSNANAVSTDTTARQAISMANAGMSVSTNINRLLTLRNGATMSWGAYAQFGGSFPDTSLALDAIKITNTSYADIGYSLGFIAGTQNTDGGWAFNKSNPVAPASQIIPTAYNIITLNRYKSSYALQSYINNAVVWLKAQQKTGGSFGEGTTGTVHETAIAYLALLTELGATDAAAIKAQDYLIAQQAADGSWRGNALSTALVLQGFPAIAMTDTDKDGIPDGVESLVGTNTNVADGRNLIPVNGNSVGGLTVAQILNAEAVVNTAFSYTITASGGAAPYAWKIISGALPPGLTLNNTNGAIAGTPTTTGTFNFTYLITDSSNPQKRSILVGQISVYKSKPSLATGDVNADGKVDVADAVLVERFSLGLATPTAAQKSAADVAPVGNPDGVITAADVARIRQKALGQF